MKLATLKDGTRDGRLVVVSRDLSRAAPAPHVKTLQAALDDWDDIAAELAALAARLDQGMIAGTLEFRAQDCLAPLPRAYQWADGSAYVNHVALVRKARGAELPPAFWTDPLMYQGGSDTFLAPTQDIPLADEAWGCDLEAEVAVITGEVPQGASPVQAAAAIRLLLLVNDVSLRGLIPDELAKGFGFFQSKPSSAFSPCAVSPDELGAAWDGGRLHRPLLSQVNGCELGRPDAGVDMTFDFPTLVAHAAKTRALGAGTIIGSGTVSNRGADGGPGKRIEDGGVGYSCLAEARTVETLLHGKPQTPFLKRGDRVRIEMLDAAGRSIFGAIDQRVGAP
ncbi:MAG: fumarylacetoacetate hydrolase family protein [Nevskia sp.]|nr:fumarylacetoacetate hydrolase family protein [Nevskia sp.]